MAILEFSNYTPDTQRNINTGARYWRGTVQAESASDSATVVEDVTGLAGLDTLSLTLTAPSGYQSADIPVVKLMAVLDGGITVEVADMVPTPAVPRPSGVSGGQVFTAEIDLTDVATITPAELYRIEAQYSGSQNANRLAPLDIYVIARGLGRGLGGGSGGVTPVPVPTPVFVSGGGRVESVLYEDTANVAGATGYRTITLAQDISALENAELEFHFMGTTGRVAVFTLPVASYNAPAARASAPTGATATSTYALQLKASGLSNDTTLGSRGQTTLYILPLTTSRLAYGFTNTQNFGTHQLTIRLIQYNSMFGLGDVQFATTWNSLIQSVRESKAALVADGAGNNSNYIQIKKFNEETWWLDVNLSKPLVVPDIVHSSQVVCVFPPDVRPAVDAWFYYGSGTYDSQWIHITAADGTVRLNSDLNQYTNRITTGFVKAILPAVFSAPPGVPQNVTQTADNSTEVTINWETPIHDGNDPITSYHVLINQRLPSFTLIAEDDVGPAIRTYTFTGLTPGTAYSAQVSAENSVARSRGSIVVPGIVTTPLV